MNSTTKPTPTRAHLLDPLDTAARGAIYSPAAAVRRLSGSFYGAAPWPGDSDARASIVFAMAARVAASRRWPIHVCGAGATNADAPRGCRITLPRPRLIVDGRHGATARELDRAADIVAGLATMRGARLDPAARPSLRALATRHGIGWTLTAEPKSAEIETTRTRFAAWCCEDDAALAWTDEPGAGSAREELQRPLHTAARLAWAATAAAAAHDPDAVRSAYHALRLIRAAAQHGREAWNAIRESIDPATVAGLDATQREQVDHYAETLAEEIAEGRAVLDRYGARAWMIANPESEEEPPSDRDTEAERDSVRDWVTGDAESVARGATNETARDTRAEIEPSEAAESAEANERGEAATTVTAPNGEDARRVRVNCNTLVTPQGIATRVQVNARREVRR